MSAPTKKSTGKTKIENLTHKDKRVNIPTEELRDMVADEEKSPQTLLYPRDTSIDPQLVWRGKDEQDRAGLSVPVVPIYIQEKIHPRAVIEDLQRQNQKAAEAQQNFFSDFNGIDFEKQVDFYHHTQNWTNRMILGDSLLVMESLAEKEGLKGKIQMIYFDPPYGIKFGSNWQVSTRKRDVKDGKANDITRQPEQVKAFRDTWQLGIHSYLAYLRDRLRLARELLLETGSIFVQIGDENVHLVRCVLDEVFGSENFVSLITFAKTSSATAELLAGTVDHIIWYASDRRLVKFRNLYYEKDPSPTEGPYNRIQFPDGTRGSLGDQGELLTGSRIYRIDNLTSQRPPGDFPVDFEGRVFRPSRGYWKTGESGMRNLVRANRLESTDNGLYYVRFIGDFPVVGMTNLWGDTTVAGFASEKKYVVETSTKVVLRCILMTTDPGDLVLDPTCGSGTTAVVAEQWGRRWITTDTSRVAIALARTRLMSAKYPYYILADSKEGIQKEAEVTGHPPIADRTSPGNDVRRGFVYKKVPHIQLKSIANNQEVQLIHESWQGELDSLRALINRSFKEKWEEWQVPRNAGATCTKEQINLLSQWQALRQRRQVDIDASIARHADTENLFDQPYEDNKRIRVTGPFTVESLSPHRVIAADSDRPASEIKGVQSDLGGQYETFILDNLRKAGVQNTFKNERLKFDRLDPFPGEYIQATGEYTDSVGKVRRVAVHFGPQYGTVGPDELKEAAKEAVKGIGFDILIVCGFAFDPHVSEEAKR